MTMEPIECIVCLSVTGGLVFTSPIGAHSFHKSLISVWNSHIFCYYCQRKNRAVAILLIAFPIFLAQPLMLQSNNIKPSLLLVAPTDTLPPYLLSHTCIIWLNPFLQVEKWETIQFTAFFNFWHFNLFLNIFCIIAE